jgi:hypothetical protein
MPADEWHHGMRGRMSTRQRIAVYLVMGGVWVTGCAWLILDRFFAARGPFGATLHPWQPGMLLLHALIGILSVYLLGWVSARHALRWWRWGHRRRSGGAFAFSLAVLTVSGFALFFLVDDESQHVTALTHDVVGLLITGLAIQHWFFAKVRRAGYRGHDMQPRLEPAPMSKPAGND